MGIFGYIPRNVGNGGRERWWKKIATMEVVGVLGDEVLKDSCQTWRVGGRRKIRLDLG